MQQFPAPPQPQKELPGAVRGLVMGILSIVVSLPLLGLILGILGARASSDAKALHVANPGVYQNGNMAAAGYICSVVGIVIGSITTMCGCVYVAMAILWLLGMAGLAGAAGAGP